MKIEPFDALIKEKYGVSVYDCDSDTTRDPIKEMRTWCSATFGVRTYKPSLSNFYFMNESDRLLFIMRWTE
jgi:hypothetical protein